MKCARFICVLGAIFLCSSTCSIYSQASETSKIVFVSTRDGNREIYTMNPDGSQQVRLTQNFALDIHPNWSPTGEEILFVSDRDGVWDLYLMDADGRNVRRVFKKSAHREHPTWSPDGKQIAYVRGWFIYIATLGNQGEMQLVNGFDPTWSPNGTEIAFARGDFGSHRLTLINVRTGKQKRVLPKGTISWQHRPAWSVTGEKIAFSWLNHVLPVGKLFDLVDKETIYVVNRDGTGLERIVPEAGKAAMNPVWDPRGDSLVYEQKVDGDYHLLNVDLASRARTQLTHIGSFNELGDWFDPVVALPVSPQQQSLVILWGAVKVQ